MVISAASAALHGAGHLIHTYRGPKLLPRDPGLREAMQRVHPVITTGTTMWRAWLGFNVSHSIGLLLFGFFYGYLALAHPDVLFESVPLLVCGLFVLSIYMVLARAYWFVSPLIGIGLSLLCYVVSLGIAWA